MRHLIAIALAVSLAGCSFTIKGAGSVSQSELPKC